MTLIQCPATLFCVGCGRTLLRDGSLTIDGAFTRLQGLCQCGSLTMVKENGELVYPESVRKYRVSYEAADSTGVPHSKFRHVEYVVGWSAFTSIPKARAELELVQIGYTRTEDCSDPECRDLWTTRRSVVAATLRRQPELEGAISEDNLAYLTGLFSSDLKEWLAREKDPLRGISPDVIPNAGVVAVKEYLSR